MNRYELRIPKASDLGVCQVDAIICILFVLFILVVPESVRAITENRGKDFNPQTKQKENQNEEDCEEANEEK